nr:hypothetical protein Q903MT_gene5250 [Picea sitchensis]
MMLIASFIGIRNWDTTSRLTRMSLLSTFLSLMKETKCNASESELPKKALHLFAKSSAKKYVGARPCPQLVEEELPPCGSWADHIFLG